jgi:hypothetical protein
MRRDPTAIGTSRPKAAAEARGNSRESRQSLFQRSERRTAAPGRARWAVGERTPPGRTGGHDRVAPLARGGVPGRLVANPGLKDGPETMTKEVRDED